MKLLTSAIVLTLATGVWAAPKPQFANVGELADRLAGLERYNASATYGVLLPNASDEIVYKVGLQSISCPTDTLSECDYLIDWELHAPSGMSKGFSSYNNGSHFRYRDERLQEYHFDWDSIPFITGQGGVQRNAQFVDILPQYLGHELMHMAADSAYEMKFTPDVAFGSRRAARIDATEIVSGFTARQITMLFDNVTGLPLRLEYENNPGQISEQSVAVDYHAPEAEPMERFTEDMLIARYPDIFERLRMSNFRAENMPGTELPAFSLPTLTGERYTRARGDDFASPVIVAMLDATVDSTQATIADIRSSVEMLPFGVDVLWVFTASNIDQIEQLLGEGRMGETALISGRSLARDTGVTSFPTLFFVNRSGKVGSVQLGYNKSLPEIVIEKTSLLK